MCGIAGFNWNNPEQIRHMTDAICHRGPDDEGLYCDSQVSLGHRRLSIIDTSPRGHQPMQYRHLHIVYNGEVYNFPELRTELEAMGHHFQTGTDTEVILAAYQQWDTDCVNHFNGMWAFCIYDPQQHRLFLSRDRFGVKPLYYYFDGSQFIFASELKAIRPLLGSLEISTVAVNAFFYQKYIGSDRTIYDLCRKLKPSENLVFDLAKKHIQINRYFDLSARIEANLQVPLSERIEQIAHLIPDAVGKRLIADVPVGSFLSGGLDSSLISAWITRQKENFQTFSIGFKEASYDEVPFSKKVAELIRTQHHVEYLTIDEAFMEEVLGLMDEPFGDASLLPTALLSKMTRQHVTVCLSGDAGDEVFGGYDSYKAFQFARFLPSGFVGLSRPLINLLPPSDKKLSLAFKLRKFVNDYHPNPGQRHLDWMATFPDSCRRALLEGSFIESSRFLPAPRRHDLTGMQLCDFADYLPEDILKKADMASMIFSLEVRIPFLDYRLVPLVLSLPDSYKIRYFKTKWLLKKLALGMLPPEIINRQKRGFTVPISEWIRNSSLIRHYLTDKEAYRHGFISQDFARRLLTGHLERQSDNARQLWLIFIFNYWWNRNV